MIDDLDMAVEEDAMATTTVQAPSPLRKSAAPPAPAHHAPPAAPATLVSPAQAAHAPAARMPKADAEIEDFLGGAFGDLLADDEEAMTAVKPLSDFADVLGPAARLAPAPAPSAPPPVAHPPAAPVAKGPTVDSGVHGRPVRLGR